MAHFALFMNMGQVCIAGSRTFVHEKIYDEFVKKATARAQKRVVGSPWDKETESGPQVRVVVDIVFLIVLSKGISTLSSLRILDFCLLLSRLTRPRWKRFLN